MTETAWLLAAVLAGLFSVGHCLPMCGGLVTLLAQGVAAKPFLQRLVLVLSLSIGRIATYTLLGLGLGALLQLTVIGSEWLWLADGLRLLSGLMLMLMGLYVGRFWFGLNRLERLGARLWPRLQPILQRLRSIRHPGQAMLAGAIWGLLPCGLVYSALTIAASRADAYESGLFMAAFGLGTLPVLTATGLLMSPRAPRLPATLRILAAVFLLALGTWVCWLAAQSLVGSDPHQHHAQHQMMGN